MGRFGEGKPLAGLILSGIMGILVLAGLPGQLGAVTLSFNPKVGSAYAFEVGTRLTSEFAAFDTKQPANVAATGTINLRIIGFRQGMFILDLWENENHTRRFLKPDGTVVGAPGEDQVRMPFFWTLPAGDWQPGQPHRLQRALPLGQGTVVADWELVLQEVDATTGRARIGVTGQVALPSDRLIQRTMKAKGTLFFDPAAGCFDQGDWALSYSLAYSNKEIAVMRGLWKVEETRTVSFRLKGITNE